MNNKISNIEVAMAGFGGQGVLTIGLLMAKAGLSVYNNVSWFPTYETWQRGGKVYCCIILSDEEILSPIISMTETLFVLDEPSLDLYEDSVFSNGLLVSDSTLIERKIKRDDVRQISLPSTKMAQDMGSIQVANLILFGAYLSESKALPLDVVESTLGDMLKEGKKEKLIPINIEALRYGYKQI
ncbi:MAG: 2-oxoacid:acceptor oxidoreductase family protein [Spirochaetota bacterium]|nr:2-oxoacid:acceptor oxidoreductase family protein [Spirochaetota bacterium]